MTTGTEEHEVEGVTVRVTSPARTVVVCFTREALGILREHFTDARADGPQVAVRAAGVLLPAEVVAGSCAALTSDLLRVVDANE